MQVTLQFYKNHSDSNVLNKSLENGVVLSATLKSDTSVEEPTFLLSKAFNYDYNYLFCPELNKYYYVDKPTLTQGAMKNIKCREDALMSLSDAILGLRCTVARNENFKNGYLIDNQYKAVAYEQVVTKPFPHGMTDNSVILMTMG